MSTKTRKRIWPVSMAAVIGVVVMLAVLVTVTLPAGTALAQPADPAAPMAVTGLSAAPADTSVALSWTAAVPGPFATSGHEVEYQAAGASSWVMMADGLAADATSYEVTGLTAGTSYNFRVRAVAGTQGQFEGPWAMVSAITTGGQPPVSSTDDGTACGSAADSCTKSSSSTGSGAPEIKLIIESMPGDMSVGSSIVLYLEDDFQEPDSIPTGSVYLVAEGSASNLGVSPHPSGETADIVSRQTGNGARVYVTSAPKLKNDGYFDTDKSDIAIRVLVPDMCTNATDECEGPNGLRMGQMVTVVFESDSGIKNPSEVKAGGYKTGYDLLSPTGDVKTKVPADTKLNNIFVNAEITLSDVDNKRGYELTVTGSGFNDGTTATAWVLGWKPSTAEWWDELDCTEMKAAVKGKTPAPVDTNTDGMGYCKLYNGLSSDLERKAVVDGLDTTKGYPEMGVCRVVINKGTAAGSGLVSSDDTVAVSFEVTVPTFSAGKNNYICMNDGEDRQSDTDVEDFHLEPSIRVVPSTVSSGDTVNVFAQDYPFSRESLTQLKLAGTDVFGTVENLRNQSLVNGSAAISFEVPGSINGAPLQGTVRLDARWGNPGSDGKCNADDDSSCTSKNSKITVTGSELTASITDVLPNETITITGNGFGTQTCIDVGNIQLDGVALQVDDESTFTCRDGDYKAVEVSNSGQFVATITMWPQDTSVGADNPTLISGTHTLDVEDSDGFVGSTKIMIAEPTISVVPDMVGPRDYVVITGTNWPIDNSDNSNSGLVTVVISDDANARTYSVYPDNVGRFTIEHRVSKDVAIPSTNQVKGSHSDVVKIGSFTVPSATVTVTPNQAQPGDTISLSATDMKPYAEADYVKVGGTAYNDPGANTDIDGNITIDDVLVPGLDPGTYSVIINVDGTVAIGELEVLAEDSAAGSGAELPGALEELGDSLVRVFHFNGVDKSWDFYDPRDEFAELNTLTTLVNGEPYWVLVSNGQEDVVLNNRARTLTCVGGDCWNQIVW